MNTYSELLMTLRNKDAEIKRRFGVKNLGVFGSYVQGEQHDGSDLDILVDYEESVSLFEFLDLKYYLEDLLSIEVDLVSRGALQRRVGERILREVEYV
jgi:predicted nucleotidyltransferase